MSCTALPSPHLDSLTVPNVFRPQYTDPWYFPFFSSPFLLTLDGDTVVWTGEEDVLTPEELEEFHRDAIKLMEESEQQKEVAIQG